MRPHRNSDSDCTDSDHENHRSKDDGQVVPDLDNDVVSQVDNESEQEATASYITEQDSNKDEAQEETSAYEQDSNQDEESEEQAILNDDPNEDNQVQARQEVSENELEETIEGSQVAKSDSSTDDVLLLIVLPVLVTILIFTLICKALSKKKQRLIEDEKPNENKKVVVGVPVEKATIHESIRIKPNKPKRQPKIETVEINPRVIKDDLPQNKVELPQKKVEMTVNQPRKYSLLNKDKDKSENSTQQNNQKSGPQEKRFLVPMYSTGNATKPNQTNRKYYGKL